MESSSAAAAAAAAAAVVKNSSQPSSTPPQTTTMLLIITFLILTTPLLLASFLSHSSSSTPPPSSHHQPLISPRPLHPIIKTACTNTLYSKLCFATLSSFPSTTNATTFHHLLEFSINQTLHRVSTTRFAILRRFKGLNSQEKNALDDCVEMIDQTLYELGEAIDGLHRTSYGNIKTLLSAAMTNENTCIDGFADLEESKSSKGKGLKKKLQKLLNPILRMISNCLAITKYMETLTSEETPTNPRMFINKLPSVSLVDWMTKGDGKMMKTEHRLMRPDVIVAGDGSGNYTTIREAITMAPNMRRKRYVMKIKAGIYEENVVIPREKVNIMLVGDGMNSTVITGSKNLVDGFSTFTSATLTVVGDKFLARDLTIINTSGPEKHQAVALRVNSNAAFYRCEIISYQDTLYAHSLRQLYRECIIQGTVDFIFGNAAAIFQNCLILVRQPNPGQRNMITAQGRVDPNQNTGISLQNCTIMAAPDFTERGNFSTFLGRPWRNYSRTIIMKSYLGDLIDPQGWCKWNEYSNLDTVEYMEYMNFGPGSDTRRRVRWAEYRWNRSEDIERQFTVGAFLHGADDWLESTVFPLFSSPQERQIQ